MEKIKWAQSHPLTWIAWALLIVCALRFFFRYVERRNAVSIALLAMCIMCGIGPGLMDGRFGREVFPAFRAAYAVIPLFLLWALGRVAENERARASRPPKRRATDYLDQAELLRRRKDKGE